MSRTRHKEKQDKVGFGKEYWKSRLTSGGEPLGKYTKIRTHRKERREGKQQSKENDAKSNIKRRTERMNVVWNISGFILCGRTIQRLCEWFGHDPEREQANKSKDQEKLGESGIEV